VTSEGFEPRRHSRLIYRVSAKWGSTCGFVANTVVVATGWPPTTMRWRRRETSAHPGTPQHHEGRVR
jgi:hypothetical protein